jgi:hypothetical protein
MSADSLAGFKLVERTLIGGRHVAGRWEKNTLYDKRESIRAG